jgi:transposase-like protein
VSPPSFTEPQVREAVASARTYSDVLRAIGLRPAGGNHRTIRKYIDEVWKIPTDHFSVKPRVPRARIALEQVLVEHSTYHRQKLKARLYEERLKERKCELCGQDEEWQGRRMALILDHINGVATDNRLENLRIVCPNCNATLETHCGRNKRRGRPPRVCDHCGGEYRVRHEAQRFCSKSCGAQHNAPKLRRAERPPYEDLLAEIEEHGYLATGRRHGVSDNAIRKWVRAYEREASGVLASRGERVAQRGDEAARRVALREQEVDAVDPLDGAPDLLGRERGDDSDQRVARRVAHADDAGALEGRQPEVEQDRVGALGLGERRGLVPVSGDARHAEAGLLEDGLREEAEPWGVVADQHSGRSLIHGQEDATSIV